MPIISTKEGRKSRGSTTDGKVKRQSRQKDVPTPLEVRQSKKRSASKRRSSLCSSQSNAAAQQEQVRQQLLEYSSFSTEVKGGFSDSHMEMLELIQQSEVFCEQAVQQKENKEGDEAAKEEKSSGAMGETGVAPMINSSTIPQPPPTHHVSAGVRTISSKAKNSRSGMQVPLPPPFTLSSTAADSNAPAASRGMIVSSTSGFNHNTNNNTSGATTSAAATGVASLIPSCSARGSLILQSSSTRATDNEDGENRTTAVSTRQQEIANSFRNRIQSGVKPPPRKRLPRRTALPSSSPLADANNGSSSGNDRKRRSTPSRRTGHSATQPGTTRGRSSFSTRGGDGGRHYMRGTRQLGPAHMGNSPCSITSMFYISLFLTRIFAVVRRRRERVHFENCVAPRAVFTIQCMWRRSRLRERLVRARALQLLVPWLHLKLGRLRRTKEASALLLQRVFRGQRDRSFHHMMYWHMRYNGALRVVKDFVWRWEAQKYSEWLRIHRDERCILLKQCEQASMRLLRAEREQWRELMRENMKALGVATSVTHAEWAALVELHTGTCPNVLPLQLTEAAVSDGGGIGPCDAQAARKVISTAVMTSSSRVAHETESTQFILELFINESCSYLDELFPHFAPPEKREALLQQAEERRKAKEAQQVLQPQPQDGDEEGSQLDLNANNRSPGTISMLSGSSPGAMLLLKSSMVDISVSFTTSTSSALMMTDLLMMPSPSSQHLAVTSHNPSGTSDASSNIPLHPSVPTAVGTPGSFFPSAPLPEAAAAAASVAEGEETKEAERNELQMDEVLAAYLALLARTESIERKVLEQQLLKDHAAFLGPVSVFSQMLSFSHVVPPLFAPLLLPLRNSTLLRQAVALFQEEQRKRFKIMAAYDAVPLSSLNRPLLNGTAETRRRRLLRVARGLPDPFLDAVKAQLEVSNGTRQQLPRVGQSEENPPQSDSQPSHTHNKDEGGRASTSITITTTLGNAPSGVMVASMGDASPTGSIATVGSAYSAVASPILTEIQMPTDRKRPAQRRFKVTLQPKMVSGKANEPHCGNLSSEDGVNSGTAFTQATQVLATSSAGTSLAALRLDGTSSDAAHVFPLLALGMGSSGGGDKNSVSALIAAEAALAAAIQETVAGPPIPLLRVVPDPRLTTGRSKRYVTGTTTAASPPAAPVPRLPTEPLHTASSGMDYMRPAHELQPLAKPHVPSPPAAAVGGRVTTAGPSWGRGVEARPGNRKTWASELPSYVCESVAPPFLNEKKNRSNGSSFSTSRENEEREESVSWSENAARGGDVGGGGCPRSAFTKHFHGGEKYNCARASHTNSEEDEEEMRTESVNSAADVRLTSARPHSRVGAIHAAGRRRSTQRPVGALDDISASSTAFQRIADMPEVEQEGDPDEAYSHLSSSFPSSSSSSIHSDFLWQGTSLEGAGRKPLYFNSRGGGIARGEHMAESFLPELKASAAAPPPPVPPRQCRQKEETANLKQHCSGTAQQDSGWDSVKLPELSATTAMAFLSGVYGGSTCSRSGRTVLSKTI